MTRKKLPIGIQTFAIMREESYYYVDKTRFILQLAQEGRYYFLSRPRRFGKSLLIDTIAELYAGSEPLFQGLYCHDKWNWQHKHPVIRISFTEGVRGGVAGLDQRVREILAQEQKRLGVSCVNQSIAGIFSELISEVHAATGQRVVVLIDEYDKPILDSITRPDEAREIRDALRNLYSVLKGSDAHIIDTVWRIPGRQEFTLKYPNYEVQASLNDSLLQALSDSPMLPGPHIGELSNRPLGHGGAL